MPYLLKYYDDNFEKVLDFLMISIDVGFYQMQMNVISSDILIKAKNNPEEYPNLTIRVSGYAVQFCKLDREKQLEVIARTFHERI